MPASSIEKAKGFILLYDLRKRISHSMTGGVPLKGVLLKSLGLSLICTLLTAPYFCHLLAITFRTHGHFSVQADFNILFVSELFMLFLVCFLSSVAGFSFTKKMGLPGMGDAAGFFKTLPLILFSGVLMAGLSYLLFDRLFFRVSPESYSGGILHIVSYPFKAAFTDEVILRFALVTISIGILKKRFTGVLAVSAIASVFTIKYFKFMGLDYTSNHLFISQLLISFVLNLILGWLFVTRGLFYSMALHFVFAARLAFVKMLSW